MDPDETLRRIRELSRIVLINDGVNIWVYEELATCTEALDKWLSSGGFLPEDWKEGTMEPIPVGTLVEYTGSQGHGRYVITAHKDPLDVLSSRELTQMIAEGVTLEEVYLDGVAYEIWKEGVLRKFGNMMYMITRVRRSSLAPVDRGGITVTPGGVTLDCPRCGYSWHGSQFQAEPCPWCHLADGVPRESLDKK